MPVFDRFVAARKEALPAAYLLPARFVDIVTLLRRQGIEVARLRQPWTSAVERFVVDSITVFPLFEGHRGVQVDGGWTGSADTTATPGWYVVSTEQPLGMLAAYLLEPASEDGMVTWNFLDRELAPHIAYPVLRTRAPIRAATEELSYP
jgi:dipeptidyl-peptidase-4